MKCRYKTFSNPITTLLLVGVKGAYTNSVGSYSSPMVGVVGLEPTASWSRTMRDTKLRHTPIFFRTLVKSLSV